MTGATGTVEMDFYYPGELKKDQWVMVYVNEEPRIYLEMQENLMHASVEAEPYETLQLEFKTNFYLPDAQEQRGKQRLAVVLAMRAD